MWKIYYSQNTVNLNDRLSNLQPIIKLKSHVSLNVLKILLIGIGRY